MKLNRKHKRFCEEYLEDLNATQAAIRTGYSKKTARIHACKLLTNPNIQKEVERLMKLRSERTAISQDRVLRELAMIGFSDIRNYVTIDKDTGAIQAKGFEDMPKGESRVLRSVKEDRVIKEDADGKKCTVYDKVKFELWDKPKALEMIGRHLTMFTESHIFNGNMNITVISAIPELKEKKNGNQKKKKKKRKAAPASPGKKKESA